MLGHTLGGGAKIIANEKLPADESEATRAGGSPGVYLDIYPADRALAKFKQNVDTEERLLTRIELEMSNPALDHRKLRIRLNELSAINQEVLQQIDLLIRTGMDGGATLQRAGATTPRAQAVLNRAKKIMHPEAVADINQASGGPPTPPVDKAAPGVDDGDMEARVAKLEALSEKTVERLAALERDVAVIISNYATKADISALAVAMHADINSQTWKLIPFVCSFGTALVGATYFLATHIK